MQICVLLVLSFCASCTMTNEQTEGRKGNWTVFRGSPSLCGYTDCALPSSPQLLWSAETHSRTNAAPIVYDGWVYTLDRKGCLRRFSPEGDSLRVYDFRSTVEAPFLMHDSVIYVGRTDGWVNAFSLRDSKVLWEYETLGQISGSPNLVNGQLLVGSYDGSMYTLDSKTGRKTGQFETNYYINGAAAVWDGYIVFGGCDAWLRVVDTATGTVTDSLELDSYIPASPAVLDGVVCACDYSGNVYEIQLDNGRITEHRQLVYFRPRRMSASKAEANPSTRLLSATPNEREQSRSEHVNSEDEGVISMPTLTRTDVYILSGDRNISCIDRKSGTQRWKKTLRGIAGECSPLVARDKVLVCTKDGHISILDSRDGSELWHYEAGEPVIASPAIIADRFYIITSKGTLLCFV